ncbi:MAG: winged helix DNA-binding domain-containing protein [Acidimicrobiia bacterium]
MRTVTDDERRARLGVRHFLAPGHRAPNVAAAAHGLCGLHATDPASVYLSARARVDRATVADIQREMYDERTVLRMLGMRRTMFVLDRSQVSVVQAACTDAVAARERRTLVAMLEDGGVTKNATRWLAETEAAVIDALEARGEATGAQISAAVPAMATKVVIRPDKKWGGEIGVGSRVLTLMAAEGHIVRGRPKGSWISSQYAWTPTDRWLPEGIAPMPTADARAMLVDGWLHGFGPGTLADIAWWTGLSQRDIKAALTAIDAVTVLLEDGTAAYLAADDSAVVAAPKPWVALLPALDPAPMGWTQRDWYLGPHKQALFDRSGNVGPTVWSGGRIVGGWGHRRSDGEIAISLFEDPGKAASKLIAAEAKTLREWIGDVRVSARFPTPTEKALSL